MTADKSGGLIRVIADLMSQLQHRDALDVDAALQEMTHSAVESMPGAQYGGITLVSRDGTVRSPTSTGRYPALLDEIQQRTDEGPCLSAAWEHHTIRIDDMKCERRWPYYCRDALQETPIRSVISFRLFSDHKNMGAMNFFAEAPHAFDGDEAGEMGFVLASHAAVAWNLARRDEQFRSALASRDIIGQAKGMIMERFGIDAVQAFDLLKRLSQSSNTPLAAIATQLVETGPAT